MEKKKVLIVFSRHYPIYSNDEVEMIMPFKDSEFKATIAHDYWKAVEMIGSEKPEIVITETFIRETTHKTPDHIYGDSEWWFGFQLALKAIELKCKKVFVIQTDIHSMADYSHEEQWAKHLCPLHDNLCYHSITHGKKFEDIWISLLNGDYDES